jgi:hypothetical protein
MDCVLCSEELGPVLADGTFWRLVLNRNQNLIGMSSIRGVAERGYASGRRSASRYVTRSHNCGTSCVATG